MKGAFLVSTDTDLFFKARDYLMNRGADYSEFAGSIVFLDELGRRFTFEQRAEPEWEFRDEPITPAAGVTKPDMTSVAGYGVECRWEDLFIAEVGRIAALADGETWVLDGDGVLWSATDIDINRLRL